MSIERANEIINSLGVIDVTYNGVPVWLENFEEKNDEIRIKELKSGRQLVVDVSELKES